ncbi:DeoR faimly transcriptional regulator [Paenibacillus darwinianus]|uniref:MFS-type drug efflux transporter P55 n=1 Tax=Paenibacillus darwinianus TaxID=1380763 RepID=A0A9W5S0S7_9BACL|nr:MFS transporter [Paenibacillus darwinianus]EXX87706.1 DeoR faimly transcriptional regulator [Paenibacillus darwinianus]EXX90015.1 DeoR faimly transcriptional regulator [Paenibacillus darwinianus]EXX90828.1 DeoR faimly transcriptional regulator [Paenibacillus darwinianus]
MKSRKLAVMSSIVLAMLVASMDSTIMNTTMPVIAEELNGRSLFAWSFTSYMIFATVLAPLAGRISDLFGRKRIFGFGIILFLLGSLLSGMADTMLQLVLFRAVQGIGAGVMMPFPIIIAGDLYPVEQRGKIQALFTAMWGLSAVLAPLLGAVFVEQLNWRWIFYINIPICIISFLLLLGYKEVYEPKRAKVDVFGSVLFAVGISLLLAATTIETYPYAYAAAGALVLVFFFLYEKRHASPIVPLTLFRNKPVRWMIINGFTACSALFGTSSYVPLFLQENGYSLFESGVSLLSMSAGWMITATPAGKWVLRYGYARLLLISNGIILVSGALLALLGPNTGFWYVFFALFVQGAGFGLLFTVGIIGSQQLVAPHEKGVSASLQMFGRNIGTAIGVTIMGSLLINAPDFMQGIRNLFVYGLIAMSLAMVTALFVSNPEEAGNAAAQRAAK